MKRHSTSSVIRGMEIEIMTYFKFATLVKFQCLSINCQEDKEQSENVGISYNQI